MTKIYSMCSNDFVVPSYKEKTDKKSDAPHAIKSAIIVKGGANVAFSASNKHERNPKFAITEVDAKQLEALKANPVFMRKVDRGFITIGKEPTALKADKSAQATEKQMKAKAPKATASTGEAGDK